MILKAEETDVKSCESSINERVAKNIAKFAVPGQCLSHQKSFKVNDLFQLKFTSWKIFRKRDREKLWDDCYENCHWMKLNLATLQPLLTPLLLTIFVLLWNTLHKKTLHIVFHLENSAKHIIRTIWCHPVKVFMGDFMTFWKMNSRKISPLTSWLNLWTAVKLSYLKVIEWGSAYFLTYSSAQLMPAHFTEC